MKTLLAGGLVAAMLGGVCHAQLKTRPPQIKPAPIAPRQLANQDAAYLKLRTLGVSAEQISIEGFTLKRDAGTFVFRSGTFTLLEPVNGKVTGAVFQGDAGFTLVPPIEVERRNLAIFTKGKPFEEQINTALFRFTDGTEEEIRKAALRNTGPASGDAAAVLKDVRQDLKRHLKQNLDVRLLRDVLSTGPGGKFMAFFKGKRYGAKFIYDVDPMGVVTYGADPGQGPGLLRLQDKMSLAPEEIALIAWDYDHSGVWTAFHFSPEYSAGTASGTEEVSPFLIELQKLEVGISEKARLDARADTTITALADGVRVLAFDLFPTLRVDWVAGETGEQLGFIQEDKEDDADFAVILPRELKKGETYTIVTKYAGDNAVTDENNGNYYPVARDNWYPSQGFGHYTRYEMTFRIPGGMKLAATGKLLRTLAEGKENITEWESEAPMTVAGFNFGRFKSEESKDLGQQYIIETDANTMSPNGIRPGSFSGTMNTTTMMKKASAEAQIALDLYTKYFGAVPYKRLSMTQQTAMDYGQSWPGLVFLPISYFLDSTARHGMGFGNEHGFFKSVGPHEIAHQWWGQMVGYNSYRDQWMSEGFAEMSASLFLQSVYREHGLSDFHEFWAYERKLLTDENKEGRRAIDVGPVTLGYRLATAKTGFDIPRRLIYPKGGYILHMLRVMLQESTAADPDVKFKAMMQDFASTYANRSASTEDFKAMVEKHMTREMDLDHNHKMDWFFSQFVYGTEYPKYRFEHSFTTDSQGMIALSFKLSQSHVSDGFMMLVPVYLEMADGKVVRLGRAPIKGNNVFQQQVALKGIASKPKRAFIGYMDDVMGDMDNK
jgi:Peptidase family M1 domain